DQIIRNFLEFSRPPELRVQPCDVWLLIDKTLELLKYKLEAGNIRVERAPSAPGGRKRDDWPALRADPQQFQQVLLNLVNNAVDAQPDGGLVRLSVDLAGDNGDVPRAEMMVIRISDAGPGVLADVAGRIFDPFFSTKDAGAGLGLWIARRIVTQHGGMLELEGGQPPFSPESASDLLCPPDRGEKGSGPLGGAAFAVWMPIITGSNGEQHSGRGRRSERAVGAGATAE
ncbi:MAG TPA: ATP-binding protein, partial [Phycisphaerae bacterium]